MAWATPKTDWDSSDVLASTDFNRMEGNTAILRNTRHISAMLPHLWDYATYAERLYHTCVKVPAGMSLKLRRFGANAGTADPTLMDIGIDGEAAEYHPTLAVVEDTGLDFTLYVNATGVDQNKILYIDYPNPTFGVYPWTPGAAFHLTVEIV